MSEREPISFPTNHISREDLASVDPTRKTAIDAFTETEMEAIAKDIGEAVNDVFWTAAVLVLERHFAPNQTQATIDHEQGTQSDEAGINRDQTPEKLIALKDAIMTAFHTLPPEHKATISFVIVGNVMEGEWGDWMLNALNRLYPPYEIAASPILPFPIITREQLQQTAINPDDINILTDDDLTTIATNMHSHYINDLFWDELAFHTQQLIERKQSGTN